MSVHFGCLAFGTSQDEFPEEGKHSWPPIVPLHVVERAKESFMPSGWGFVEGLHEVKMGRFRNVESVFKI